MPNSVDRTPGAGQATRLVTTWGPAALMMALIFTASSMSQPLGVLRPGPLRELAAVAGHFVEYALLALALLRALRRQWPDLRHVGRWAWTLALIYALGDEWHQSFVPGRMPELLDLVVDGLGAAAGLLWAHARARRSLPPFLERTGR